MKILQSDFKKGFAKLKIENLDDLWYISQVIDPNDVVKGKTTRKVKIGGEGDRKQAVAKKTVFLAIKVEKAEFAEESNSLRISGTVLEGPEDVPLGSHHTLALEENSSVTIEKENWLSFQIDRIKEASKESTSKILICVHDREEAYFALLKKYGYELISSLKGNVQKKADLEKVEGSFYKEIITKLQEYAERYKLSKIILASPAFWKEDLLKEVKNDTLKKKIILATSSSADEAAINEVLKRPETEQALKEDRISKEARYVEELFVEIAKQNLAAYGIKETKLAAEAGAVKTLLVTDKFIHEERLANRYAELEEIMKSTDSSQGTIIIVNAEFEPGKKLEGLGGVAAILRYKMSY